MSVNIDVEVHVLQIFFYLERLCFMTYGYRFSHEKTKGSNKYEINCTKGRNKKITLMI